MEIGERIRNLAQEHREQFLEILEHCHMYPEISLEEVETARYIRGILSGLDMEFLDAYMETGTVALLKGGRPGPCIALRADIDALPVTELSSAPVKSRNEGKMHACGHDMHYASLLCAAILLSEVREEICGSVKFIFQPAEEWGIGAKEMVSRGVLEDPHVDAIFSFHNSPEIPTGTVACIHGPIMAGDDEFKITLTGKGGHGGIPQRNVDPVVAAAALIQSLQTVVSRNVGPVDAGVISVCSLHAGGTTCNVVPDKAELYGTTRFYRRETKELLERRIREITAGIAAAYGVEAEIDYTHYLMMTDNLPCDGHRDLYDIALRAARGAGAEPVSPEPSGGADDFSIFMLGEKGMPGTAGFFYWLGVRNEEKDCVYSWHSPRYRADTEAITTGASLFALSALYGGEQIGKEQGLV